MMLVDVATVVYAESVMRTATISEIAMTMMMSRLSISVYTEHTARLWMSALVLDLRERRTYQSHLDPA